MPLLAEVRVWSWEAESAFMEATQTLSAPHWTVSSSESIMLQIELGNEARGSWLRRIVQPRAITVPPASTETEWRLESSSRASAALKHIFAALKLFGSPMLRLPFSRLDAEGTVEFHRLDRAPDDGGQPG